MQVLNYETYYSALIIFIVIFFIIFFYHVMFHSEPQTQSCIYLCKTTYMETKQIGNSTNLAGKIEHAQFTMQHCARLPCKIACQLLCNIATFRIPGTLQGVARNMLQDILHAILHRVGRPLQAKMNNSRY